MRSRIPSQPTDQSAGQARTGTGAVRSRDCLDAPGGNSADVFTVDNAYVMFEALRVDYGTLGPFGDHP